MKIDKKKIGKCCDEPSMNLDELGISASANHDVFRQS
jgi:hypothetical protein